ncbi:hypothetical protein M885DRAFT_552941, partial [Pelagophyceae sp. CCMP2097]
MIVIKELQKLLASDVGDGVDGAMLLNARGDILAAAGYDGCAPEVISAITAAVWPQFASAAPANEGLGDLHTMVFDMERGQLAFAGLFDATHFVCLFSQKRSAPGWLLGRLRALTACLAVALA